MVAIKGLEWVSDNHFKFNGLSFINSTREDAEARGAIFTMETKSLVDLYEDTVFKKTNQNIVEVGIAGGGAAIFLDEICKPRRLCLIDLFDVTTPTFKSYFISARGSAMRAHLDTDQGDHVNISAIIEADFESQLLDLVIDDASHVYESSVATFEALFPRLAPGGLYIIEDWGWSNWKSDYWQAPEAPWAKLPALTNLIHQLVMASSSNPNWISKCVITSSGAVFERGPDALTAGMPLADYYVNRGKVFSLS